MSIYMNGKITSFENIFDAVNPKNPDYWWRVTQAEAGRKFSDILTEWSDKHQTYYYLNGVKTVFELK